MVSVMRRPTPQQPRQVWRKLGLLGSLLAAQAMAVSGLPAVAGEIYHYIEPDGTISFSNVPTDPRYKRIGREPSRIRPRVPAQHLERVIARHSFRHRIDPALIRAVIKAESDFDPVAVSKAGAIGLMQLMPKTAVRLDIRDPYDPEENVSGGARYLRYLLDRFHGNLPLALAAYNAGEHRVGQTHALPPFQETREYVSKVLRFYDAYLFGEYGLPVQRGTRAFRPWPSGSQSRPLVFEFAPSR